jgi:hypothetical protein
MPALSFCARGGKVGRGAVESGLGRTGVGRAPTAGVDAALVCR